VTADAADRRVILVTGAARNLGEACASRLAADGYDLVLTARQSDAELQAVAQRCRVLGARVVTVLGDISREQDVARLVAEAMGAFGRVDGYVANAAVRPKATLAQLASDEWERVLGVDLTSAMYLARSLAPSMAAQGWGRIVHTSGLTGWVGSTDGAHVAAAKAGLHGLTRALAIELASSGITVNTVVPAAFDTTRDDDSSRHRNVEALASRIPVGRLGRPGEYAALCAYLLSEDAGYMTGQALHLNGGYLLT
jgi:3-oxoacyl-[acyl-carrier protein] reductase